MAFLPLIFLILTDKNMDSRTKRVAGDVGAALAVLATVKLISRELHVSRNTVGNILRSDETAFGYQRARHPCLIGADWPATNATALSGVVELVDVPPEQTGGVPITAVQMTELMTREKQLGLVLQRRAGRTAPPIKADWKALLVKAIGAAGGHFDSANRRHLLAIEEQAAALARVSARRLTAGSVRQDGVISGVVPGRHDQAALGVI